MNLKKPVIFGIPVVLLAVSVLVCAGCGSKEEAAQNAAGGPSAAAAPGLGGPNVTSEVRTQIQAQEHADSASRAASAAAMAGKPPPPAVKK